MSTSRTTIVTFSDGTTREVDTDIAAEVRGLDDERDLVIAAWTKREGGEYLVVMTPCCDGAASCDEHGTIYCKGCYEPVGVKHAIEYDRPLAVTVA